MSPRYLNTITWLDTLSEPPRAQLREHSVSQAYDDGQMVFVPDINPSSVFILNTGLVRIYRLSSHGDEFTLGYIKQGEVFGELAAYGEEPRESFAQAIGRCTVLIVPKPIFVDLIRTVPEFGFAVSKQIETRFKSIEARAESLVFLSVESRLASALLMLMENFGSGQRGGCIIQLRLTQAEFATLVGTSRPTINQTFRKLRALGLIRMEKGHVAILNPEGLRQLAQQ